MVLAAEGIDAVELAPTKVHPDPLAAPPSFWRAEREFWESRGLGVAALQAILFGKPELEIFGDEAVRIATRLHLKGMSAIAAALGARFLVFGAPRNRRRKDLPAAEAMRRARDFFKGVGEDAAGEGVCIVIEPNPPVYACDFVNRSDEGLELVEAVASPGFGLHLDLAGLTLSGESPSAAIRACGEAIRHFHASEPELGPLGEGGMDHAEAASALREVAYAGHVSVEMREAAGRPVEAELRRIARFLVRHYGSVGSPPKT